ncbi:hypothetical protein [Variovorax sp. dw_954]|uniref:hypothetical protein n=1 Tax=Variovorax sp. dw_954 TaxID=2720078 RepID=UPI002115D441|nr:hypothetical protein [Variovorax sp. dw_954]
MNLPTSENVLEFDDLQLASLAAGWRMRARHGDREAFGAAHVLEVERRRRVRASGVETLPVLPPLAPKVPWWKFWTAAREGRPDHLGTLPRCR